VKIVSGVPEAIPVVGVTISDLLRGGSSVGQATLTRYYSAHTFAALADCRVYAAAL